MRCPQSRPATISCRQTMAMSKPSGGGAAGGAGERRRLKVPIINAHDQRSSANSELLAGDCKIPIGDAPLPGERPGLAHLFCGEPVERGRFVGRGMPSPYCPACGALAYRAPTTVALAELALRQAQDDADVELSRSQHPR